jgi:hypothetical protein
MALYSRRLPKGIKSALKKGARTITMKARTRMTKERRDAAMAKRAAAKSLREGRAKKSCKVVKYSAESLARGWPKGKHIYPSGCSVFKNNVIDAPGNYVRRQRRMRA